MIARIHLLRRRGVLLAPRPTAVAWSEEGYVETLVDRTGPQAGRRLVLRALQSAPGCGVMFQLFRPTLVSIEHDFMRVRGIEPLDTVDGLAAVVQEWLVRPRC
jgi:hypothetical protein